jgi:hypothetical protein
MAWKVPNQTFVSTAGGMRMEFVLSVLEPSERAKIRRAQNITTFQWAELKGRVGAARAVALKRAGMEVRRATQRSMSVRKELTFPRFFEGGTRDGQRLIIKRYMVPKPDRVTSWKTERWPKGFLRSDIISDYDAATQSVVIGPKMIPRLNRLHEVGGTVSLWFTPGVTPRRAPARMRGAVFGTLTNFNRGRKVLNKDTARYEKQTEDLGGAFFWGRRRVKPRRYMRQGLDKARDKIPSAFQDFIAGPAAPAPRQLKLF